MRDPDRRELLKLAVCNLISFASGTALAQGVSPVHIADDPLAWSPRSPEHLISDPSQALSVFDFEPVMRKNVPPAHFGYMATGIDDEATLRGNRQAFAKFVLR